MKVERLESNGDFSRDSQGELQYVELELCEKCQSFQWSKNQMREVKKAINFIFMLANYCATHFYLVTQSWGRAEGSYVYQFSRLDNPLRQPYEYDSYEIRLLKGILRLAAYSGVKDISSKLICSSYQVLEKFINYIGTAHTEEKEVPPDLFCDQPSKAQMPIAPKEWFSPLDPDWIDSDTMLDWITITKGKAITEIRRECKRLLTVESLKCAKKMKPYLSRKKKLQDDLLTKTNEKIVKMI